MSSEISIGDQFLWVANNRLSSLIEFVIRVASDEANTAQEREYVAKLNLWNEEKHWPGCDFDLNEHFPTTDEKKFWATCFFNVARRIFRREIGNQEIQFWQCGMIGDAYITARLLCKAVRIETGDSWYPDSEDNKEAQEFYDRINTQI